MKRFAVCLPANRASVRLLTRRNPSPARSKGDPTELARHFTGL
jgi:hypothetical protein